MARLRVRGGVDGQVARRVAPAVQRVVARLAGAVRAEAPGTKTWVSRRDALVRPEHRKAHGQEVPDNLRFVVDAPRYDQQHYRSGPTQQLRYPRDTHGGTPGNTANCRCEAVPDPEGLARRVRFRPVMVAGARVRGVVISAGPRVREANDGTDGDQASHYMERAVRRVRAGR